jgi:hypothetical protein
MRGGEVVLRSKTPELVSQEFCGTMLAHWAVRILANEAAVRENLPLNKQDFGYAALPSASRRKSQEFSSGGRGGSSLAGSLICQYRPFW